MKVNVRVFGKIEEKKVGKNNKTVFEQSAQVMQAEEGYPDCACRLTFWDDRTRCLAPGVYTADLFFEPAPYGQMVPQLQNFQPARAAQRPVQAAS